MEERVIVCVDLGGTYVRAAICKPPASLLHQRRRRIQASGGPDVVLSQVVEAISEVIGEAKRIGIAAIVVGVPGPLDSRTGVIINAPNLPGFLDVPVAGIVARAFSLPVYVANDANLAALGEHRFGAGRGAADMVYITVSTGIGGGVITDGKLLLGHRGLAGEIGHMTIDLDGPMCNCGNRGCLEAMASGTAIARCAREALEAGVVSILPELTPSRDPAEIDARIVAEGAIRGDRLARTIIERAGTLIGVGVASLLSLFNPERVVIGGGVSQTGNLLFDAIRSEVRARVQAAFIRDVGIVPAELGDNAGLLGGLVLEEQSAHWR